MNQTNKVMLAVVTIALVIALISAKTLIDDDQADVYQGQNNNSVQLTDAQQMAFGELTREYDCLCGDCNLKLVDCDCTSSQGAQEIKSFIRTNLAQGKSKAEVVNLIAKQYQM